MLRRFSVDFAIFSMFVDAVLVSFSFWLAFSLDPSFRRIFLSTNSFSGFESLPFALYAIIPLIYVVNFLIHSVYDNRRNFRVVDEVTSLVTGSLMAAVTLFGFLFLTYREVSRQVMLLGVVIAFLLALAFRVLSRVYFRLRAETGVKHRRVLVIGAGPVGLEAVTRILAFHDLGLSFQGFLDDRQAGPPGPYPILGALADARKIVLERRIDDVVLALPRRAYERLTHLVTELHDLPVRVWVIPDYFALALNRAHIEELAGMQMIDLRAPALDDYQRMAKRAFDTVITLGAMPLALPLMAMVALCIKLDSPGPVLFRQKRAGENGRIFEMFKFRSMVVGAESRRDCIESIDGNGKVFQNKCQKDPRVTRVGAFIRRTSLDELPQLFNVLRGEMSLVGPRPELPYMVDQYEPWQRKRFAVPQGITGWWQVNGRSDKPMGLHTEEDIYYVQNYSIWLDLQILIKTVFVVFRRKGAY
ncbi:MAG: sugar transferase [Anaerolineaceae bacterium]|nr:sugar transferase [Anaerolineaceae bacterium]